MGNNFEFDKIVWAIAFGILTIILSNNLGDILYHPHTRVDKSGYKIEVKDDVSNESDDRPKDLPAIIDIKMIMSQANASHGAEIFSKCAVCHTNDKNGLNKVGPNLWGIVNAKTARHSDFSYSIAMKALGDSGSVWTQESLYRYLFSPKKYVPGTKMSFVGIKDDKDRADLVAYLSSLK